MAGTETDSAGRASKIVERETQLSALEAARRRARAGAGSLVVVRGGAGAGKTALVQAFTAARTDRRVAWAHADPLASAVPLGPIIEAGAGLGLDLSGDDRAGAAQRLLARASALGPAPIIVMEDVHWADAATLDVLVYIGRRIHRLALLIIVTARDDEKHRGDLQTALGELATSPGVMQLSVPPLSPEGVNTLAGAGGDSAAIWKLTGGNAFFVSEVLAARGAMPPSVTDAVRGRLSLLSPPARHAARVVAVAGPRCEGWLAERLLGAEADAIEPAVDGGLIVSTGDILSYRHELARDVVLDDMPASTRASMHRRVLDALATGPASARPLARLVHHAEAAGDASAVARLAPLAAQEARGRGAHREAAAHFRRALQYSEQLSQEGRADLLEAWGGETALLDERTTAIDALRDAAAIRKDLGDAGREAEDHALLTSLLMGAGRTSEAELASRAAIDAAERVPPAGCRVLAYRAQAGLRMLQRDTDAAREWGERALALAGTLGIVDTADIHNAIGSALIVSGSVDAGTIQLGRAIEVARATGTSAQEANALANLGSALGEMGLARRAREPLERAVSIGDSADLPTTGNYASAWLALVESSLGEWDRADRRAAEVLVRASASTIARIMALICRGRIAARRGASDPWTYLDEALALAEEAASFQRIAPVRSARSEAAWLAGDSLAAATEADACLDEAIERHHAPLAEELAYRLGLARRTPVAVPEWCVGPYARLGAGDWRGAADAWAESGAVYERAHALAEGDDAARVEAVAVFETLGASPRARELRSALRRAGVAVARGPRLAARTHRFGLTPREAETLDFVARGLSNTEIAERLTVSPRTVEHHLSSILAKTGARTRGAAVAIVAREGLVDLSKDG